MKWIKIIYTASILWYTTTLTDWLTALMLLVTLMHLVSILGFKLSILINDLILLMDFILKLPFFNFNPTKYGLNDGNVRSLIAMDISEDVLGYCWVIGLHLFILV